MTTAQILAALSALASTGILPTELADMVSSPEGAPSPDAWLAPEIIAALDTLEEDERYDAIDALHVAALRAR